MIQVNFWQVDLKWVVEAVKFEKLPDQLSAHHTRSTLHDLFGLGILPMKARLAFLDLILVINDFENAWAKLSSELSEDAVCLESLYHKVL